MVVALTYSEAQERSRLIDVLRYHVELDLTGGGEVFGSVTVVRFGCHSPGASTFIELSPDRLRTAVLNGRELDPAALVDNRLTLTGLLGEFRPSPRSVRMCAVQDRLVPRAGRPDPLDVPNRVRAAARNVRSVARSAVPSPAGSVAMRGT